MTKNKFIGEKKEKEKSIHLKRRSSLWKLTTSNYKGWKKKLLNDL